MSRRSFMNLQSNFRGLYEIGNGKIQVIKTCPVGVLDHSISCLICIRHKRHNTENHMIKWSFTRLGKILQSDFSTEFYFTPQL